MYLMLIVRHALHGMYSMACTEDYVMHTTVPHMLYSVLGTVRHALHGTYSSALQALSGLLDTTAY
jgi:hypothetical protein